MGRKNTTKNNKLIELLSPRYVDFKKDSSYGIVGERYVRVLTVTKFPLEMDMGWISQLTKIKNISVSYHAKKKEKMEVSETLKESYKNLKRQKYEATDLEVGEEEIKGSLAKETSTQMYQENHSIFYTSLLLIAEGNTLEELENTTDVLRSEAKSLGVDIVTLMSEQLQGYKMASPLCKYDKDIGEYVEHMMLTPSLASTIMQNSVSLKDDNGFILGKDSENKIIIMSIFNLDKESGRNNHNCFFVGSSGSGKTATLKKFILSEFGEGSDIIVIDPDREFKKMAHNLSGEWVDMGSGQSIINPLQIRNVDENEDDKKIKLSPYAQHIRLLRMYFETLYKDFTKTDLKRLEEIIEGTYARFNITDKTDISNVDNFPIMKDLYDDILKIQKNMKTKDREKYTEKDLDRIEKIRLNVRPLAIGADKYLFNGKTNISLDNPFIVFDINDLQDADDELKAVQYFNILSYAYQKVVKNPYKKVILVIEEAHILIDKDTIQTVKTIRNFQKRFRKFLGSLLISTQELGDFTLEGIKDYGKAILNNATYKVIMGCDGDNLKAVDKLYDLTEKEKNIIRDQIQGRGIMIAGNKRLSIDVEIEDYEFELADI